MKGEIFDDDQYSQIVKYRVEGGNLYVCYYWADGTAVSMTFVPDTPPSSKLPENFKN